MTTIAIFTWAAICLFLAVILSVCSSPQISWWSDLQRDVLMRSNLVATGAMLMSASAAILLSVLGFSQRLGVRHGSLQDTLLVIPVTIVICAMLFAAEGFGYCAVHGLRLVFVVPVLVALYSGKPPGDASKVAANALEPFPIAEFALDAGICAAGLVGGILLTLPLTRLRDSATSTHAWVAVGIVLALCWAFERVHSRYTTTQLPETVPVRILASNGEACAVPLLHRAAARRTLRDAMLRHAQNIHMVVVATYMCCYVGLFVLEGWALHAVSFVYVLCEVSVITMMPLLYLINRVLALEQYEAVGAATLRVQSQFEDEHRVGEARRHFMRYIFHEVRAPFNSITLGLQVLAEEEALPRSAQEHVGMMQVAVQGMSTILNEVLEHGAMEEGQVRLTITAGSIDTMLQRVVHQLTPWAIADKIAFIVDVDPCIPVALCFDVQRLGQVAINLCTNAFKFVKHDGSGRVALRASLVNVRRDEADAALPVQSEGTDCHGPASPSPPEQLHAKTVVVVRIEVTDNGCGIPESEQSRLFVPYYQVHSGIAAKAGFGTGLGLSIVKEIVGEHGGEVHVTSTTGKGSTFSLEVPLALPPAAGRGEDLSVPPLDQQGGEPCSEQSAPAACNVTGTSRARQRRTAASQCGTADSHSECQLPRAAHEESWDPTSYESPAITPPEEVPSANAATLDNVTPNYKYSDDRPLRFLIVDDVASNRKLLLHLLRRRYGTSSFAEARDGHEAVTACGASAGCAFDAVLIDGGMPCMSGVEATRRIRARFDSSMVLVLGCTGNALPEDQQAFLDAGANHILVKPIDVEACCALINQWCSTRQAVVRE